MHEVWSQSEAAGEFFNSIGSKPTFAALANEISVKPEGERRHCGQSVPSLRLRQRQLWEADKILT